MISKDLQAEYRSTLFQHLDGIGMAPTAWELHEKGVLDELLLKKKCHLSDLVSKFEANEGYLNVALRILCSQGWLSQQVDNETGEVVFKTISLSSIAFKYAPLYHDVVGLLKMSEQFHPRRFELKPFLELERIFKKYQKRYDMNSPESKEEKCIQDQVLSHIEGILLGPTIVNLGMSGMFHKYFMEANFRPEEFHSDPDSFGRLLDMFAFAGWFEKNDGTYRFTEKGLFYARRASAYGVTVSYIPTFRHLNDLIFGNPLILKTKEGEAEKHVDRAMNVWGSGGAHAVYFKIIDEIIIEIFNQPIADQPKGILDMGCGNGAFLQHLFDVIENRTLRGKMLDEYPLTLVGADYNKTAMEISKANLVQADIWAKVVWGDIGDPDGLAKNLHDNYRVDLADLLNVRTFLDHNRIWEKPSSVSPNRVSQSTGAFATEGQRIDNNSVEDSLLVHFKKWTPYVKRFGLLLIELHTVDPSLVALNLGKTAVTAYDATHGFSDQYIVEVAVFQKILEEAGLKLSKDQFRKFPNSDLASVTINLYKEVH